MFEVKPKKVYTEQQMEFFENMNKLRAEINAQFKIDSKELTEDAIRLQDFIYDTHGLDLTNMSDSDIYYFRKKDSTKLYTYKFVIKCLAYETQYQFKFDVPIKKSDKMTKAIYTILKLIENQSKYRFQVYINCCNFYANTHDTTQESLANLRCLYCDLDNIPDVDFTNMSDEEIKAFVKTKYAHVFNIMPFPNYITVSSKAGLHLYFLLNDYAVKSYYGSSVEQWKSCGFGLQRLFNVPEFDTKISKDTQRILRLPLSLNAKIDKMFQTRLIDCHKNKLSLQEYHNILSDFIPEKTTKIKVLKAAKTKKEKKKVVKIKKNKQRQYSEDSFKFVKYQLKCRYADLLKWFISHRMDMDGKREIFFFILVNTMFYLKYSHQEIRDKVLSLNAMLPKPLAVSELESCILNYNRRYLIGNYKVAMYLNFTEEEKKNFTGRYIANENGYNKINKKIHNEQVAIKRKIERGVHNKKVKALLFVRKNSHLKNSTIANSLGCSSRTVQRLKNSVSKLFKKSSMTKMTDAIKLKENKYQDELMLGEMFENHSSYHQYFDYIFEDNPLLC